MQIRKTIAATFQTILVQVHAKGNYAFQYHPTDVVVIYITCIL